MTAQQHSPIVLNQSFLIFFVRLFNLYWFGPEKWRAVLFVTIAIILTISGVRRSVMVNASNKAFFDALQTFNMPGVMASFIPFGLGILIWIGSETVAFYCPVSSVNSI